jgi:hypothetical protein
VNVNFCCSSAGDSPNSVFEDRPPALPVKQGHVSQSLDLSDSSNCSSAVLRHSYHKQLSRRTVGHSPTSSISSNPVSMASSLEDILSDTDGSITTPVICVRQGSRLSNYDNMIDANSDNSSSNTQQSVEDEIDGFSPPLPEKMGSSAKVRCSAQSIDNGFSLLDGLSPQLASVSLNWNTRMHQINSCEQRTTHSSVQFMSRSDSRQSNVTSTTTVHLTKSIHVTDSDSGYMSATHLQPDALAQQGLAPPLPPKLKHSLYFSTFLQFS